MIRGEILNLQHRVSLTFCRLDYYSQFFTSPSCVGEGRAGPVVVLGLTIEVVVTFGVVVVLIIGEVLADF
jgi:hypothetical protein